MLINTVGGQIEMIDLEEWLRRIGCGGYIEAFRENGVSADLLAELSAVAPPTCPLGRPLRDHPHDHPHSKRGEGWVNPTEHGVMIM